MGEGSEPAEGQLYLLMRRGLEALGANALARAYLGTVGSGWEVSAHSSVAVLDNA